VGEILKHEDKLSVLGYRSQRKVAILRAKGALENNSKQFIFYLDKPSDSFLKKNEEERRSFTRLDKGKKCVWVSK
jgi:hypothetical protein